MLLPTALMFLIYVFLYWGDMSRIGYCALGEYKFGYWFTFVLFLMNVMHWAVSACLQRTKRWHDAALLAPLFLLAAALIALKNWDWTHNGARLAQWFSLRLISMYFPFYLLGMACRHKEDVFRRIIGNEYAVAGVMVAFAAGLLHEGGGFWFAMLMGVMGTLLLYRFCYCYQEALSEKTFVGRQLSMIGRNTLPVYLIHYFWFMGLKLPMVGRMVDASGLWFVKIIVAFILTMLITYASIGMLRVVEMSRPLARVLLGKSA